MHLAIDRRRPNATGTLIWGIIGIAWLLALLSIATGDDRLLRHDAIVGEGQLPHLSALLLFLAAWQVMTAAMMLPSSRPMVVLFAHVSRGQRHPGRALATFLAGYFAVWTGFSLVALTSDAGIHRTVEHWPWLDARPWLITGSVLVLAGAFQFSPLKDRCLDACRSPMSFLMQRYGRGLRPAWALGVRHGLFCLGCCWALMLTMVAVGVGSVVWMAALTGVMVIEKTMPWGRRLVPVIGTSLMVGGGIILLQLAALPL